MKLPTPTAWITVVDTTQGPSSQVNWTRMRGVKHHPLFSEDQLRQEVAADRAALLALAKSKGWGMKNDDPFEDSIVDLWEELDRAGR
jgi:hypothetical protein